MDTSKEKAPNYTEAQVQELRDNAPLNLEKAKALAVSQKRGKNGYRSIIAKAKREGIPYESKEPVRKKPKGPTKRELVALVSKRTGLKLASLEKATYSTIVELAGALNVEIPEAS